MNGPDQLVFNSDTLYLLMFPKPEILMRVSTHSTMMTRTLLVLYLLQNKCSLIS